MVIFVRYKGNFYTPFEGLHFTLIFQSYNNLLNELMCFVKNDTNRVKKIFRK